MKTAKFSNILKSIKIFQIEIRRQKKMNKTHILAVFLSLVLSLYG